MDFGEDVMRRMAQLASAFDILRTYLQARAAFRPEEFDFIKTKFVPRTLGSGDILQRTGEVAEHGPGSPIPVPI